MKIQIKTVKGEVFPIDCTESTTVGFLKERIFEKFKNEPEIQKLIFRGKHLDDQKTVGEVELKDGDTVILMVVKVNSLEGHSKGKGSASYSETSTCRCASSAICSSVQQSADESPEFPAV